MWQAGEELSAKSSIDVSGRARFVKTQPHFKQQCQGLINSCFSWESYNTGTHRPGKVDVGSLLLLSVVSLHFIQNIIRYLEDTSSIFFGCLWKYQLKHWLAKCMVGGIQSVFWTDSPSDTVLERGHFLLRHPFLNMNFIHSLAFSQSGHGSCCLPETKGILNRKQCPFIKKSPSPSANTNPLQSESFSVSRMFAAVH